MIKRIKRQDYNIIKRNGKNTKKNTIFNKKIKTKTLAKNMKIYQTSLKKAYFVSNTIILSIARNKNKDPHMQNCNYRTVKTNYK